MQFEKQINILDGVDGRPVFGKQLAFLRDTLVRGHRRRESECCDSAKQPPPQHEPDVATAQRGSKSIAGEKVEMRCMGACEEHDEKRQRREGILKTYFVVK